MKYWNVLVFGKLTGKGFMAGKAFANDAFRAVELCGEPTAIAFPSLELGEVVNAQEGFEWATAASDSQASNIRANGSLSLVVTGGRTNLSAL